MAYVLSVSLAMAFCVATPFVLAAGEGTKRSDASIESAFSSTVARISVPPGEQAVPVEWTYTNLWEIPLMVERIEESCGCLSAQAARKQDSPEAVAPGETGKIQASFTAGGHRGLLRKSLHVRFVGHDKPVELVVEATIPSHVELSQRELVWKAGGGLDEKIIEVKSGTGADFNITGLMGLPKSQFTLTTETLVPLRHYRLLITPVAAATGQQILQVRTDSPDPRDQVLPVFLFISTASADSEETTP